MSPCARCFARKVSDLAHGRPVTPPSPSRVRVEDAPPGPLAMWLNAELCFGCLREVSRLPAPLPPTAPVLRLLVDDVERECMERARLLRQRRRGVAQRQTWQDTRPMAARGGAR